MSKEGILPVESLPSRTSGSNGHFYEFKRQSAAIPSFEILRLDILRFCGLLFNPDASFRSGRFDRKRRFQSWGVSYERFKGSGVGSSDSRVHAFGCWFLAAGGYRSLVSGSHRGLPYFRGFLADLNIPQSAIRNPQLFGSVL